MACFVNKVLLEHSQTHLFTYCLWPLYVTTTDLSSCEGDRVQQSQKYLISSPLWKKFADPWGRSLVLYVLKELLEEKVASSKQVHTCDYSKRKIMKMNCRLHYWPQSFYPSCFHTFYHSLPLFTLCPLPLDSSM